jgi:hypothetical protein
MLELVFTWEYEKFEDTKGVIRSCKSKDRKCNGEKDYTEKVNWWS